jgi:hypothetical protein
VLDKKKFRKRYVLTEEKLDDIGARLEASPKKSSRLLALQCRLAECTAHTGTKFLKLPPDETTTVVLPPDCEARVRYCMWFQESAFKGLFNPELTLYSDEVWYTLSGYVNSQNDILSTESPHAVHEVPLHDLKVGVWCETSERRTIQPSSFHETVNSQRYVRLILSPFFGQLTDEEKSHGQDNATVHIVNNFMLH